MSLIINVPFSEKEEAKSLGAKWNPTLKKWYVDKRENYHKFSKWILDNRENVYILCDYIYIIEGIHKCFKCNETIKVIGFGVQKFFEVFDPNEYGDGDDFSYADDDIHIVSHIEPLSKELLNKLKEKYNYYEGYSKTLKSTYLANHCSNCNVIQGDFFLFHGGNSPFFIDSIEKAKQLKLYKVPLKNDIIVDLDIGWCSTDYMINEYAEKIEFSNLFEEKYTKNLGLN